MGEPAQPVLKPAPSTAELARQAALILGLGAFAWGAGSGLGVLDALIRGAVVYLGATTLALVLQSLWAASGRGDEGQPKAPEPTAAGQPARPPSPGGGKPA